MAMGWFRKLRERTGPLPDLAPATRKRARAGLLHLGLAALNDDGAIRAACQLAADEVVIHDFGPDDDLGTALAAHELDALVVDLGFATLGGAVSRAAEARPRVPIVRVTADGVKKLPQAIAAAAEVRRQGIEAARALYEGAVVAKSPAAVADGLLAAQANGYLQGASRDDLARRLTALVPLLAGDRPRLRAVLEGLLTDRLEQLDEAGLIYHAGLLREAVPEAGDAADAWLTRAGAVANQVYAAIDRRLDQVMVYRRLGHHAGVLAACQAIHAKLGNILPAYHLEAETRRLTGDLDGAIVLTIKIADMSLANGEVRRCRQALAMATALDPSGRHESAIAERLANLAFLEDRVIAGGVVRVPHLRVCHGALCVEAAEASGGLFREGTDGPCDVCALGLRTPEPGLHGRTIAVIGGPLQRDYEHALSLLGCKRVPTHDGLTDASAIPALLAGADGVVLVTGPGSHGGLIKAERVLAASGQPYTRVHFYGVRQVARALVLDLLPRLRP